MGLLQNSNKIIFRAKSRKFQAQNACSRQARVEPPWPEASSHHLLACRPHLEFTCSDAAGGGIINGLEKAISFPLRSIG